MGHALSCKEVESIEEENMSRQTSIEDITHREEDFQAGELAQAEEILAKELKSQGKNSGFGTVQTNLKDSVDPKKSVAAGIGTAAGGILGGVIR